MSHTLFIVAVLAANVALSETWQVAGEYRRQHVRAGARAQAWRGPDLALPGILVGALGNALGTYLGFWVAVLLR